METLPTPRNIKFTPPKNYVKRVAKGSDQYGNPVTENLWVSPKTARFLDRIANTKK